MADREALSAAVEAIVREREEERKRAAEPEHQREQPVAPTSKLRTSQRFIEIYPFCYELYPDEESQAHKVCLDVSAIGARSTYERTELKTAVEDVLKRTKAEREKASRAAQEAARNRDERKRQLAKVPLGVAIDRWWLGGFGVVFLARITLQNNSDRRMSDFVVACQTYGRSGTAVSAASGVLYESLAPKQRGTYEVNLGKVHPQSARANCTVSPGKQ